MRILLLAHSFNSLTQRLWVELEQAGHEISLELDVNDAVTLEAVAQAKPDLIIAPFLKRAIPPAVWQQHTCLVIHPGPVGDRGPAALDWAILNRAESWGVTVLQAEAEMDAGPVWASRTFPLRAATKSSLYRNEVTEAAVEAVMEALNRPQPQRPAAPLWRPAMPQSARAIDWNADDTATILRKLRASDGAPGVRDGDYYLFDGHPADGLTGPPGHWLAQRDGMVARATCDGAVWIGRMRTAAKGSLKLPATDVLPEAAALPVAPGHHDIWYDEKHAIGYLHFPFHNGAMSTDQCTRLKDAFIAATQRPTKVICLMGGPDFWSNGIHLSTIEAAASPADESWRNINAMNDLCEAIITCGSHLTIAAMAGNAGAGGVFMALAADMVLARTGVILNPHYKGMGNLYGSEYWTYLLPRRCGAAKAEQVVQARLPMGTAQALDLGLIDGAFGRTPLEFRALVVAEAEKLAVATDIEAKLAAKRLARLADEGHKPLAAYRAEELERMKLNFYGFDPSYHVARWNFIRRVPKSRTPLYLARHRQT
ncbi:hydrogenase maturation protein [Magnetospirillum sulfuroxidans]|uniref:Hydrogenase maturation protein n=1 Tax=Magnetospirillum sulfuroxidans TaxID=611300 RepID=A0ABS5IGC9_9PROT|nr:hydrogenase maturation protein [Magnetospirillum sulfuroxidans]MBR9973449.1 hydrogenase maturation protein [Magnetospirillum sulfuroxidans]